MFVLCVRQKLPLPSVCRSLHRLIIRVSNVEVCANKTRETERFQDVCLYYFLLRRLFRISSIFHMGGNSENVCNYCVGLVLLDMGTDLFCFWTPVCVCSDLFIPTFICLCCAHYNWPCVVYKFSNPYRLAFQYKWLEWHFKICRRLLQAIDWGFMQTVAGTCFVLIHPSNRNCFVKICILNRMLPAYFCLNLIKCRVPMIIFNGYICQSVNIVIN